MPELPEWLIPVLIFSGRILDVSLGTLRMLMVISGHRRASALLGFFEVLIWVIAVGAAVKNLDHPASVLAFAGGFATGTLVGMTIEHKLAIGFRVVRVINPDPTLHLAGGLRAAGYTATRIEGHGREGPVEIVFLTVRRRTVPELLKRIGELSPEAFVSVERAERVSGLSHPSGEKGVGGAASRFGQIRK